MKHLSDSTIRSIIDHGNLNHLLRLIDEFVEDKRDEWDWYGEITHRIVYESDWRPTNKTLDILFNHKFCTYYIVRGMLHYYVSKYYRIENPDHKKSYTRMAIHILNTFQIHEQAYIDLIESYMYAKEDSIKDLVSELYGNVELTKETYKGIVGQMVSKTIAKGKFFRPDATDTTDEFQKWFPNGPRG